MTTILVTAFGAFPGAPDNPSADIVRLLQRRGRSAFARLGVRLATAVLPVVHAIAPRLDALVARENPDVIVHLGVAGRRRHVCVETRARNVASTTKPDADGRFRKSRILKTGGPAARRSGLSAGRLVASLRAAHIDAILSNDAGDYVCNAAFWRSLETTRAPAIFIHVPKKRRIAPARIATALARVLPAMTIALGSRQVRLCNQGPA